jgi:hypothetical protein
MESCASYGNCFVHEKEKKKKKKKILILVCFRIYI